MISPQYCMAFTGLFSFVHFRVPRGSHADGLCWHLWTSLLGKTPFVMTILANGHIARLTTVQRHVLFIFAC